jgi:hypothetical protein
LFRSFSGCPAAALFECPERPFGQPLNEKIHFLPDFQKQFAEKHVLVRRRSSVTIQHLQRISTMIMIPNRMLACLRIVLIAALATAGGCAAYAVPGRGANLQRLAMTPAQKYEQTDPSINSSLDKKPLANFPATVAMVRIEGPNYEARTVQTYGDGNYRVVITPGCGKTRTDEDHRNIAHAVGVGTAESA